MCLSVCLSICFFLCVCAHVHIQEGDEILKINGRSTKSMLHSVAITAIKIGGLNVKLVLRREIQDEHEGESVCVFYAGACIFSPFNRHKL